MYGIICARVRSRVTALVTRVKTALRAALRAAGVVGGFMGDATRSHAQLLAENMLLRPKLVVAARAVKRPQIRAPERGLFAVLRSLLARWPEALLLVKPQRSPESARRWSSPPGARHCKTSSTSGTLGECCGSTRSTPSTRHALVRVSPSRFPFHGSASRRPQAVPSSPSRCSVACIMTTG